MPFAGARDPVKRLACLGLAAALLPAAAETTEKPLWELGAGVGGLRLLHYRGSDRSQSWLLPVPYAVYRGDIFKADCATARAVLVDTDRYDVDFSLPPARPQRAFDDPAREGMPTLRPRWNSAPKVNVSLVRVRLEAGPAAAVRAATTLQRHARFIGWTFTPVLNLDWRAPLADVGLQGGPIWGDRRFHRYFYGVAPEYRHRRPAWYAGAAGYASWQATAAFSRRTGDFWLGGLHALTTAWRQPPSRRARW